jgi:hypothetical protein
MRLSILILLLLVVVCVGKEKERGINNWMPLMLVGKLKRRIGTRVFGAFFGGP